MNNIPPNTFPPYTITYSPNTITTPNTLTFNKPANGLFVGGDAEIAGDLVIGNTKISDRLDKIEERLGIVTANEELEKRWKELAELGRKYRALERELIEKEKIWNTIKGEN